MKESVIYQDIFQKGEKKEAFRILSRQLNRKFGAIDSSLLERIRVLTTDQLEAWGGDLLDFSNISDVESWLNR